MPQNQEIEHIQEQVFLNIHNADSLIDFGYTKHMFHLESFLILKRRLYSWAVISRKFKCGSDQF